MPEVNKLLILFLYFAPENYNADTKKMNRNISNF